MSRRHALINGDMMSIAKMTEHEAMEIHLNLVHMDGLGQNFNKITPRTVWHYTNVAGLNGIVSSSSIWASDHRYMNDVSEIEFGLQILEICIAHRESTRNLDISLREQILNEIALIKKSMSYMHVLTTSFCLRGNVLSQWRAYAQNDGIAIGFDKNHIEKIAKRQSFITGPVHYYFSGMQHYLDKDQKFPAWLDQRINILKTAITEKEHAADLYSKAQDAGDDTVPYANRREAHSIIKMWCAETAAFIKHPLFEEEQEWRCVRVVDEQIKIGSTLLSHRVSGSMVVPYIPMKLSNEENKHCGIRMMVLGPHSNGKAIKHSVKFIIDRYGLTDVAFAAPFNPLRV